MIQEAGVIWDTLEFRTPPILGNAAKLTESQLRWQPPNGGNSAAWLLWHIAEVEDNWVRDVVYHQQRYFPFGASVRDTPVDRYPDKAALISYFAEVRAQSRDRLERVSQEEMDAIVEDESFGRVPARMIWIGVATSCAWHGGQLVMLAKRLIPGQ